MLVSYRVRQVCLPFVERQTGFLALLGQWCSEPCRVAKDEESLRIEALAFSKSEDEVKA